MTAKSLEAYFEIHQEPQKADSRNVSCNTPAINETMPHFSEKLSTTNGLLKHILAYTRN